MRVLISPFYTTTEATPTAFIFPRKIEEIWNDLSTGNFFHSQFPSEHQIDYVKSHIKPTRSEFGLRDFERAAVEDAGNEADEFLVFKTSDGAQVPVAAIQYKPPQKLSIDQLVTGLSSEIWPERDIINPDDDDFISTSRRLAAAVVTQLFSYMIDKGLQYGYVCTGEAVVFLRIPYDASINGDLKLHRTAVAQVFAFLLQAIRTEPPPEVWHDEAEKLGLWEVEYDDILARIPLADHKRNDPLTAPYRPQCWEDFERSPLRTPSLSRCRRPDLGTKRPADQDHVSPFPNTSRTGRIVAAAEKSRTGKTPIFTFVLNTS
ncbi:hypothetical protein V8C34DRAFT_310759 [Trichoderma compactum]